MDGVHPLVSSESAPPVCARRKESTGPLHDDSVEVSSRLPRMQQQQQQQQAARGDIDAELGDPISSRTCHRERGGGRVPDSSRRSLERPAVIRTNRIGSPSVCFVAQSVTASDPSGIEMPTPEFTCASCSTSSGYELWTLDGEVHPPNPIHLPVL